MDYRANPALGMCFSDKSQDHTRADVRARALTAQRNYMQGATKDIDGRIWALIDLSGHSERVMAACGFRIAAPMAGTRPAPP